MFSTTETPPMSLDSNARTRDLLIGLDAGTSVVKAVAFDVAGRQIAVAAAPNQVRNVAGGGVEQDMMASWRAAAAVLVDLATRVDDLPRRVLALAVTAQGDGTWLIDRAGEPVGPAWLWLDGRAGRIVESLGRDGTGEAVYRRTGTVLSPSLQSMQLLAMKRDQPERLARAATAFHCKDWLYFKLSGEVATDPCEGVNTFGDAHRRGYDDDVVARLGLTAERRLLPPLLDGSAHHGVLGIDAARATGLLQGTPVVLAPVDYLATAIGGGVIGDADDIGCSVLGSAGMHLMLIADPTTATAGEPCGYTVLFPRAGTWLRMVSNMATTLNIDWLVGCIADFVRQLGVGPAERARILELLDAGAGDAPPGRALYHPYISDAGERGPFVDPRARAQFSGLTSQVQMADLMRAIYEGIAFAARDCYGAMPRPPRALRLTGGASRSATLRRILAATIGCPVRLSLREEAGALGAVTMAAVCMGVFATIDAACAAWVEPHLAAAEAPDPDLVGTYDALFAAYRLGYESARPAWSALHGIRGK